MIASIVLSLASMTSSCDVIAATSTAIVDAGAVPLTLDLARVARDAEDVLALAPDVACGDRRRLVAEVVMAWVEDGVAFVERPNQIGTTERRRFGKVFIRMAKPIARVSVRSGNQQIVIETGKPVVLPVGDREFTVLRGDEVLCELVQRVTVEQDIIVDCPPLPRSTP